MHRFLSDTKNYRNYILYSTKAKLKAELAGSHIGWIWWILDPLMSMLIYMFVFTVVFKRKTTYVIAFIFLGISLWKFFNTTVNSSVTLIKQNRHTISKVYLPKFTLVLINMLCNGVKLAFAMVIVVVLMIYYQIPPSIFMLQIIPVLLMLFLLTFALSSLFMHAGVYFEDLANFVRISFQLLFYASGVFYPIGDALGAEVADIMLWLNPIALILNEARGALLYATGCNWSALGLWMVISLAFSAVGVYLIYRNENQYVKIV